MGIDPTIWGPKMWTMIHLICLQAPEKIDTNVRNTYYMFFSMMPYVLPCDKCREHWLEHIREFPIEQALDSREDLFKWSVNMHNLVNKSLSKPEIPYKKALEHWTNVSTGKAPTSQCIGISDEYINILSKKTNSIGVYKIVLAIILVILFITILYVLYHYR